MCQRHSKKDFSIYGFFKLFIFYKSYNFKENEGIPEAIVLHKNIKASNTKYKNRFRHCIWYIDRATLQCRELNNKTLYWFSS